MASRLKIVVGVDLHPRGIGALRFANALAEAADVHYVHVVRESYVLHAAAFQPVSTVIGRVQRAAEDVVRESGASTLARVQVTRARDMAHGLMQASADLAADMLVIGRNAAHDHHRLVRLGGVARRILREAVGPVVVVPPDFKHVGDGPIVVATECEPGSDPAAPFARQLAEQLGRKLVAAHAVPDPDSYLASYTLSTRAIDALHEEELDTGRRQLSAWGAARGFARDALILLDGEPVSQIDRLAQSQHAALVVSAPRPRRPLDRLAGPSFTATFAARTACPFAVVPRAAAQA